MPCNLYYYYYYFYFWKSFMCPWSCNFQFSSSLFFGNYHWDWACEGEFLQLWAEEVKLLRGVLGLCCPVAELASKSPSASQEWAGEAVRGREDSQACPQMLACWLSEGSSLQIHACPGNKYSANSVLHICSVIYRKTFCEVSISSIDRWFPPLKCMISEMKIGSRKWIPWNFTISLNSGLSQS